MERLQQMASYIWSAVLDVSLGRVLGWAAFLFAGMLLGIAAFNPGGLDIFENSGSAADWAAAIGTWVIGYGAWRIAREGHNQRLEEAKSRAHREREAKNTALWHMAAKAVTAKIFKKRIDALAAADKDQQTAKPVLSMIHVAMKVLKGITWSDTERAILSIDAVNALSTLEFELMAQMDTLERLNVGLTEVSDTADASPVVAMLAESAEALANDADAFIVQAKGLMTIVPS